MAKENKTVRLLAENYKREERVLVEQLFFDTEHSTTIGTYREHVWQEMFENIVPKKFVVEQSVFIIDSAGNISCEVDIVILDEMFTPYIFKKGQLKFIPIEAVAVAVQCKSKSQTVNADLKIWVNSIKQLKTSKEGIARMVTMIANKAAVTQQATRPVLIYCHLGESRQYDNEKLFDISIRAKKVEKSLEITLNEKFNKLEDVFKLLNFHNEESIEFEHDWKKLKLDCFRVKKEEQEISLLSLTFMLNQALMLLNNPMLFPHSAYVKMFRDQGM